MLARKLLLAVLGLALTGTAFGREKSDGKETASFVRYQSISAEKAQKQALAFLSAKKKTAFCAVTCRIR